MGCMTSKESAPRASHEKITYLVCKSCHESPVRDVRLLCQRCKYAKTTNKQIKPRSFCPSCDSETVQYPGEICGACSIRAGWSDQSASSRLPPGLLAVTGQAGSRAASSRRPHGLTIKTDQRSGGTAQRMPQSLPAKTERSGGAGSTSRVPKSAPAKSTGQSGGSAASRLSHRFPIKTERAEGNGSSEVLQGFSRKTGPSSGFEGSRLSHRLPIRMPEERAHLRVF
ncbi:uncharacterized protein H6S33_007538 [Morchella sextelata]|uniref:uncharacterized protein n=1 Tax=Morchella sextelata TaxID=1174677 RepID=UPI001D054978|nr:uncharacterized protein H6S33_007538 [Morchella sextelata]KAH0603879.1 hypothetical protein H6S33_007538 [Morchella sextelata]